MNGSAALSQRLETSELALIVRRILASLGEVQRIASGSGEQKAITASSDRSASPQRETRRAVPRRGID